VTLRQRLREAWGRVAAGGSRRVRTPTVLQMEATECGAAALAIVLAHHGRHVPLEELRQACGVSRDGSNAANILKAARGYGMVAKGYRREPDDLRTMALPVIVFWNFAHFVVVEGFARDRVFLNDPATGPRTVSRQEFDDSFTGVTLAVEPGPGFSRGGQPPSVWGTLLERLRGHRVALAYVSLCTLALALPGLVMPVYSRVFVDQIFVGGAFDWLKPLLAAMVATSVVTTLLSYLQMTSLMRLQFRLMSGPAAAFVWHLFRLPLAFFSQRSPGDVLVRVQALSQIASLISGGISRNLVNLLMVAVFGALMLLYEWRLATIAIATALGQLLMLRWMTRHRVDQSRRLAQEGGKFEAVGMSGLQMIETLKASGAEHAYFARWSGYQAKLANTATRFAESSILFSLFPGLLSGLSAAAVLGVGGLSIMDGALTIGMYMAFQALMSQFLAPVSGLLGMVDSVNNLQGALARLDDVTRSPEDPLLQHRVDPAAVPTAARLQGEVELRNVTFGYSRLAEPIVRDVSLTIPVGLRVALVGASGSGKSTVARIVAGMHQPWDGEVLFDGQPRQQLPRAVLCNSVALVDQDVVLFRGSVRDNVTLWDASIAHHDVLQAARDACIHDDIASRAGGYDAPLEEGGGNFSVGQRQRMEIARALALNPSVLVLDEATSALDPKTEKRVDDHIKRRGCTLLVVAHRLSTIRDCDEIIVMEAGRIVQRGTHEEMIRVPGPYATLIQAG
jgi:NHLM bacteriocin system ABC transporter peptidase/ATP-binding protein